MRRVWVIGVLFSFVFSLPPAWAQKTVRLSIATGGAGGVYYPIGRGMANLISKYLSNAEATAEVTTASVDNCLLVGRKKAELAFIMADTGWNAYMGKAPFKEKIPLRTLAVLFPNNMHIVTIEGKAIEKVTDLKGKRVSTGAPGSGTEVMALRVIEAFGLNPNKDMTRERLGVSESVGALRDKKIDAFFWVGGLPTAAVTDLGTTPGIKIKLLNSADGVLKMRDKYGPFYAKGAIPAKTYPDQDADVPIAVVWNLLVCHKEMKENVAYDILKTLFDHKQEWAASHGDARYLALEPQAGGSPIPFHPGAIRYFTEKGVTIK